MPEVELGELFPPSPEGVSSSRKLSPVASGSRGPSPVASGSKPVSPQPEPIKLQDEDDEDGGDLFGDEDDEVKPPSIRSNRDATSSATPDTPRSSRTQTPVTDVDPLEYPEEDVTEETREVIEARLALPHVPRLKPTDGKIWHLRLPGQMNIDHRPYDPNHYRETLPDETIDGKANPVAARSKMLSIKNTIRWKWVSGLDGQPVRKSNARLLRWSDGSMSFQLGSDLYDVATSSGTTMARPKDLETKPDLPSSQQQPPSTAPPSVSFLCVAHRGEQVLETEAAIAGQLSLVPTTKANKTHMELVKQVGQQHVRHSRMKILEDVHDADEVKRMLRQAEGRLSKPKVRRSVNPATPKRPARKRRFSDESDLDREDNRPSGPGEYDEDDGFVVADDDDEEQESEEENEDEAAWGSKPKAKKGKKGRSSKGRKRKGSESLDEMEIAERKITAMERNKRAKKAKAGPQKSREYIDSEEEDEDEDLDAMGEPDEDEEADMDVDEEDE